MCSHSRQVILVIAFALWPLVSSKADLVVYSDKATFLMATAAGPATDIPASPETTFALGSPFTSGDLTFLLVPNESLRFNIIEFSSRMAGRELAISGLESFDIDLGTHLAHSFGFDFVEPEFDPNVFGTGFVDSEYQVTLLLGGATVDSFTFSRPNDSAEFVGVWTDALSPFNRVAIRETSGGDENEFFGQFYVGTTAIPEPGAGGLLTLGLLGMTAALRSPRRPQSIKNGVRPLFFPTRAGQQRGQA